MFSGKASRTLEWKSTRRNHFWDILLKPIRFRRRDSKVPHGANESKFPIGIIVFYEYDLIVHVIQG